MIKNIIIGKDDKSSDLNVLEFLCIILSSFFLETISNKVEFIKIKRISNIATVKLIVLK